MCLSCVLFRVGIGIFYTYFLEAVPRFHGEAQVETSLKIFEIFLFC